MDVNAWVRKTPCSKFQAYFGRLAVRLLPSLLIGCACWPGPAQGQLLINEFLPDPAGTDSGREFVELLNSGPGAVDLDEVELQFANGSVGADWVTRWRGAGYGALASGARFLITDRNWLGAAVGDAEVYLGLQNGPDAIRLIRGTSVLDLVGYGHLTDADLFEGAPVMVPTGLALARKPDGRDTGENAADFAASDATPGSRNFQPHSVAVLNVDLDPPFLDRPGEPLRVTLELRNDGTEELPGGPCRLSWAAGVSEFGQVSSWWDATAAGGTRTLTFVARLDTRGLQSLNWQYVVPGTADTLQRELGLIQVGAGPLRFQEVMPAPDHGQGEWVELQWAGAADLNLLGHELRDADGGRAVLPPLILTAGQLAVVAEDSSGLMAWWEMNRQAGAPPCVDSVAPPLIVTAVGWPSLNNSVPESRSFADRLLLVDPQGVVLDAVAWGGPLHALPDRGLSLERITAEPINPGASNWMVSTSAAGSTPGCTNSVAAAVAPPEAGQQLSVSPPLLDRNRGPFAVHLCFSLWGQEAVWELIVFSLWGEAVRDFGGDARGQGPRDLVWDGRDNGGQPVASGAYIAWLEVRSASDLVLRRDKIVAVVR